MTDLNALRAAALDAISRFNVPEITPALPLRWRVIIGDSESMDSIAPVCPSVADTAELHVIADYPGGPIQDETGVYDCCPTPWIEAGHGEIAAYLVALLNADAEAIAGEPAAPARDCAHCGGPIPAERDRKEYCDDRCRWADDDHGSDHESEGDDQ